MLCGPGKCSAFQLLQEYLNNVPVALGGRGEADLAGAKRGDAEVHKTNKERNSNEFSDGYHTGNRGTFRASCKFITGVLSVLSGDCVVAYCTISDDEKEPFFP